MWMVMFGNPWLRHENNCTGRVCSDLCKRWKWCFGIKKLFYFTICYDWIKGFSLVAVIFFQAWMSLKHVSVYLAKEWEGNEIYSSPLASLWPFRQLCAEQKCIYWEHAAVTNVQSEWTWSIIIGCQWQISRVWKSLRGIILFVHMLVLHLTWQRAAWCVF